MARTLLRSWQALLALLALAATVGMQCYYRTADDHGAMQDRAGVRITSRRALYAHKMEGPAAAGSLPAVSGEVAAAVLPPSKAATAANLTQWW